jgi:acrylyl-CoA reductase (NADPH)
MNPQTFSAMVVRETAHGQYVRKIEERHLDDLPAGDVLIAVQYSSLNYKDALSATGNKGVTRHYPHTPGIDAAGEVVESRAEGLKPGDPVLVTGYDLGMNTAGGFGQYIRVPADWVVKLPDGLSLHESMIYGTAGFTAGLSLHHLTAAGITPGDGEVLVTGATGGVGSLAVALLHRAGYPVTAASGKSDQHDFLTRLGANRIIDRESLVDTSNRPLLGKQWAAAVDTVGGNILSTVIRSTRPHGVVTCCGNVASAELHLTVYPFILRGVRLMGVDSATCPREIRMAVWQRLAREWKPASLVQLSSDIPLAALDQHIDLILKGRQTGRRVVALPKS